MEIVYYIHAAFLNLVIIMNIILFFELGNKHQGDNDIRLYLLALNLKVTYKRDILIKYHL